MSQQPPPLPPQGPPPGMPPQGPPPGPPQYDPGQFPEGPYFPPNGNQNPERLGPTIGKVTGINLGALVLYTAVIISVSQGGGHGNDLGYAIIMMFIVAGHALVNLILMIVFLATGRKPLGMGFLVSFFAVLILGFGACVGGANML